MQNINMVDKKNYIVLGILIRSSRINQGYSLRDLGELTKISHTLISNIETGKQIPTENTLADIFRTLKLKFYDSPELITEFNDYYDEIMKHLFNQEYDEATSLINELMIKEDIYINSVQVVNYVILKLFFHTITNTYNKNTDTLINHYKKMMDFYSDNQRQLLYFVQGLDHWNNEHYNKATDMFEKALSVGNETLDVFIKEYNISSLIRQYKFIDSMKYAAEVIKEYEDRTIYIRAMKVKLQVSRIYYHIAKNDEVEKLVNYVHQFAIKFQILELIDECAMLRAAVAIRYKKFDQASSLVESMPHQNGVSAVLLKFKIAFEQNDLDGIEQYYNEVILLEDIKNHEKIYNYLTIQTMSKIESIYDKEMYFKYISRLCELSKTNNDQEMIGIAYNYLIMYYHEERRYKKALEIAERLLRLKKIRI